MCIQKRKKTLADAKEMFYFQDFINNAAYVHVFTTRGNYACVYVVRRLKD